ncbi:MAG: putative glycolipid-binding domain-containing protein [Mycobacterium sp.]
MTAAEDASAKVWPAVLTWRSHDVSRIESARIALSGNRIKAHGRIVAAASGAHPAFSASYDLVTDDSGATKRLSLNVTSAERERQMSIARDEENMWLITDHEGESRAAYNGAMDVDMVLSPFFNALPIRRTGLHTTTDKVTLPVVYVYLPDLTVTAAEISYTGLGGGAIELKSPVAETTVVVDDEGFIVDYPGLAERI